MTGYAQQNSGFTRRTLLRSGLLAGGTAAVVGASVPLAGRARAAASVPTLTDNPDATAPQQWSWVYCNQCMGMFYCGTNTQIRGWCPDNYDGEPHANTSTYSSYNYGFYHNGVGSAYQGNWFWCRLCSGLFWGKDGNVSYGVCPYTGGNGPHDGSSSFKTYLVNNTQSFPGFQPNWLWCKNCSGLFYGGSGTNYSDFAGMCPIDGGGSYSTRWPYHLGDTSDYYYIQWQAPEITLVPGV